MANTLTAVRSWPAVRMRRGTKCLMLIACLASAIGFLVGCGPVISGLEGIELLMTPQEVEELLGQPSFYLGDADFRWSWHEGGVVVGYARSSTNRLQAVWVLQNQGSLEAKLRVGATQAEAERLYGEASAVAGLAEPRIPLEAKGENTLDIVLENGRVSAFFLCLPAGRDPDIRLAGTGPGELPTFELNHPDSIDICPTSPGTTWVREEDLSGNGFYSLTYETIKDTRSDGGTTTVVYRWEAPDWDEQIETEVTISGDVCFYEGRPERPTRLYVGLEWSSSVVNRNIVVGTEPLEIKAGQFPEALVVYFVYPDGWDGATDYYVDGIGLVQRAGLELVEFHPGSE